MRLNIFSKKIGYKLLAGFSFAVIIMMFQSFSIYYFNREYQQKLINTNRFTLSIIDIGDLLSGLMDIVSPLKNIADGGGVSGERERFTIIHEDLLKKIDKLDTTLTDYKEEQSNLPKIRDNLKNLDGYARTLFSVFKKDDAQNKEEGASLFFLANELIIKSSELTKTIQISLKAKLAEEFGSIDKIKTRSVKMSLVTLFVSSIILILLAYAVIRSITAPLSILTRTTEIVAKGDFTKDIDVKSNDEIGTLASSFKMMILNITNIIRNVLSTSEHVSSASQALSQSATELNSTTEEVSSTVQQIASGAESTAKRVQETSHAMEQMNSSVNQVAESAKAAATASLQVLNSAKLGLSAAEESSKKMGQIYTSVISSSDIVKKLGERSGQITEIVDVISNIADQTNLLALNAAIEAARAGETGRGFAVVADEVRKLAENSAKATNEISKLIKEIKDDTNKAVTSMEVGRREVDEGIGVIKKASDALFEIGKMVESTASMVEQIAASAEEMNASSLLVKKSVEDIAATAEEAASATGEASASTEEMTASMETMAAKAHELANVSQELNELVETFKIVEDGVRKPKSEHNISILQSRKKSELGAGANRIKK